MDRLALGSAQFGLDYGISNRRGRMPEAEIAAILDRAARAGIGLIDTAATYGDAEGVLGRVLHERSPFRIVTKTLRLTVGIDAIEQRARASRIRLGRACLDALLVHSAADLTAPEADALWLRLQCLKKEGLYAKIGFSAYWGDRPLALAQRYRPDVVQLPVSILDQRLIEDGTLTGLKAMGVEIHVRSVFLQGLLLMDPVQLPARLEGAIPSLYNLRAQATAAGTTPLVLALAFVYSLPEIDHLIVGITCRNELDEIVAAVERQPPAAEWSAFAVNDEFTLTPSRW